MLSVLPKVKVLLVGLLYMLEVLSETEKLNAGDVFAELDDIYMLKEVVPVLASPFMLERAPLTEPVTTGPNNLYTAKVCSKLDVVLTE